MITRIHELLCDLAEGVNPSLSNDGVWMTIDVALGGERQWLAPGTEAALLEANGRLPAAGKLCLSGSPVTSPRFVSEAPAEWSRTKEWVRLGLSGFHGRTLEPNDSIGDDAAPTLGDTAEVLEEAGWKVLSHTDAGLVVQLEGTGLVVSGKLAIFGDQQKIFAVIARTETPTEATGFQAACRFLLRLVASVRLVRPTLIRHDGTSLFGIEVGVPLWADVGELNDCFEALSICVARAEQETPLLLADERLATAYLQLSGGIQPETETNHALQAASSVVETVDGIEAGGDIGLTALTASAVNA